MHLLSKSSFISGLQCEKKLFMQKYRKDLIPEVPASQQFIFSQGTQVGELAQELFSGGMDATPDSYYDFNHSIEQTKKWINNDVKVIYEAAFQFDEVLVAVDILVKGIHGWKAYEVKSSTEVKKINLDDAAELWKKMYFELSVPIDPSVDAITSRDEPYLIRVAMIYALANGSEEIERTHLETAYAFIKYAKDSTNYIFGGSVLSKKEQKLFDAIKSISDGYSRTQAFKLFNNHVKADGLNKLLSKLEEMNLIHSKASNDDDSKALYCAN
ncbi:MAG: hypothetical protein ACI857_002416 [Arenicella sp.]|jgi:hypothetical protein